MFNKTAENDSLRRENVELKAENIALQKKLDTIELDLYRRLFERININIEGGKLSGQENV